MKLPIPIPIYVEVSKMPLGMLEGWEIEEGRDGLFYSLVAYITDTKVLE